MFTPEPMPEPAVTDIAEPALDALPCGILSFLDDGRITRVNATLATLLGYSRGELEGMHVERLLTIAGRIFFQTHLYPLVRLQGRADELFVLLRHQDGTDVGALMNAVRRDAEAQGVTDCVLMEVRERRKFEDALVRAKQAAEEARREADVVNRRLSEQAVELEAQRQLLEDQAMELEAQGEELQSMNDELVDQARELERARRTADDANQAKSQFLATMSHELRTPLNAIGGYVQLLELGIHGALTDPQLQTLARITRGQQRLLHLVNDVLNLSRIEAGRVDYDMADVPLPEAIGAVMPLVEPQMLAAGLTWTAEVRPDAVARADREKMEQILINVLTNAVKFTPAGGRITVRARRHGDVVEIAITDTGIGIPAAQLDRVFEPFVQVDSSHTRQHEGTGLGLAISRDLARGMGGDLRVASSVGEGATFTLVVPGA